MTSVYASPGVIKPVEDLPHPTGDIWGELARGFCAALMVHEGTDSTARDRVSRRVAEVLAYAFQESTPSNWQDGAEEWGNLAAWHLGISLKTAKQSPSAQSSINGRVMTVDRAAHDALETAMMIVNPIMSDEI